MNVYSVSLFAISTTAFLLAGKCYANQQASSGLYGKVNIIVANQNGLVAVTDSRLSDAQGKPIASAQKLFKLDATAICRIAGTYATPSPFPGKVQSACLKDH